MMQHDPIKHCTSIKGISNIGVSTYLYFRTLVVLIFLLLIMTVLYSIFALATNLVASSNYHPDSSTDPSLRTNYGILAISLGSKQINATPENINLYNIQSWIGAGMLGLWAFFFIIAKGLEKKAEIRIRQQSYSASDFSIIIEGVPHDVKQEQIQRCFN